MPPVNLISPEGKVVSVPEEQAAWFIEHERYRPETQAEGIVATEQAQRTAPYQGTAGAIAAGGLGILRTVSGGLSDVGARALGVEEDVANIAEAHPTATLIGETGGFFTPGAGGAITSFGGRLAKGAEGAGALSQIGRAGAAGAAEGGLIGAQQGLSQLALGDDPLTAERALSVLSSNVLLGASIGGGVGVAGKAVEKGLARGKVALERAAQRGVKAEGIADDLSRLDSKGLRAARKAEVESLKTGRAADLDQLTAAQKAELEAIEAARVTERSDLATAIGQHRTQMVGDKILLATKGSTIAEVRALAARSAKADKALRGLLDNPIEFSQSPGRALSALQRQQSALEGIVAKADEIRASFAGDATKIRQEALDAVPAALERNKALQERIAALAAKPSSPKLTGIAEQLEKLKSGEIASPRLSQIEDAMGVLADGGPKETTAQRLLGGTLFGVGAGAVAGSGLPGSEYLAPLAGAGLAGLVSRRTAGKFSAAIAEAETRGAKALGVLLNATSKVAPAAPVLATKVLSRVRYGPGDDTKPSRSAKLADVYRKRSGEIAQQVAPGPDGKLAVTPKARQRIAKQLSPLAAGDPFLADRLESIAARRLAYLANALPKRPDLAGMQMGPDRWQPSDMEMRSWARKAAALEDPAGVFERAAAGTVSPEDAEAMQAVFPEMLNDFKRQLVEQLPTLRKSLPFNRRLALSILTGVAVDPALDPRILRVLQAQYVNEEGSENGEMAPRATANFGSVRSQEKATPAQARSAGQET